MGRQNTARRSEVALPAAPAAPSLYERIGGHAAVEVVVDDFYRRVLADSVLAGFFSGTDMQKQRRHQTAFVTMALGGPKNYLGKSMRAAHAGRGIEDRHFYRVAGHLVAALEGASVSQEDVQTVLAAVAPLRAEIVGA